MAATLLSMVKAPLRELGLDRSTWKPVHRAKRAEACGHEAAWAPSNGRVRSCEHVLSTHETVHS